MKRQHILLRKGLEIKQIRIKNRRNQSQRRDQIKLHPTLLPIEVLVKIQNSNNVRLCDAEKKLKE